jgi:hypothetical protein
MKVEIEIKPIDQMRYSTVGDYFYKDDGTLKFEIAETGNDTYNTLVLLHEMAEELMTRKLGITEKSISDFDLKFEEERDSGLHGLEAEPGFDVRSPYQAEHMISTSIEMIICAHLGIKWNKYNYDINNL